MRRISSRLRSMVMARSRANCSPPTRRRTLCTGGKPTHVPPGQVQIRYSPAVAACKLLILKVDFGGEGGIRTHVPLRTRRFRGAPVTTTSVPLRSEWTVRVAATDNYIWFLTRPQHQHRLRAVTRGEQPLQIFNLRQIVVDDVRISRIPHQKVLVILLCRVELAADLNRGDDGPVECARLIELRDIRLRHAGLFRVGGEDRGSIL